MAGGAAARLRRRAAVRQPRPRLLNRVATRIVELDRGALTSWNGNYDAYARQKAQQLAAEAQHAALFDKKLAQEEVWIRKGVEARRTRNEGRVRALYRLREEHRLRRERVGRVDITLQEAAESGRKVFEAEGASVQLGGRTLLRDINLTIMRGDRIGIVGPNGAGKTTLIRLLLGEIEPATGVLRRGTRLEVAYYDQQRAQLQLDALGDGKRHRPRRSRHHQRRARATCPATCRISCSARSSCARRPRRCPAASATACCWRACSRSPANLLVMDEPTNDLDIDTLELLEELVREFSRHAAAGEPRPRLPRQRRHEPAGGRTRRAACSEFVGGYSDWARYRDARAAARRGATAAATAGAPPGAPKQRRLTYKEQREYDALPDAIAAQEAEQAALTALINEPGFYTRDRAEAAATLAKLQDLGRAIEAAYARWTELESRLNP